MSNECKHEFLMRHEYHGQVWWQCEEGCDFIRRSQFKRADVNTLFEPLYIHAQQCCGDTNVIDAVKRAVQDVAAQPPQELVSLREATNRLSEFVKEREHYAQAECFESEGQDEQDPDNCQKCALEQILEQFEAALTRGGELNLTLPNKPAQFIKQPAPPQPPQELERLRAALEAAHHFLSHTGNHRALVGDNFSKPSIRYNELKRVTELARAALTRGAVGRAAQEPK